MRRKSTGTVKQLGIRCDTCGLEILARPPIEQPAFQVFSDGVLCEACYVKALRARKP